MSYQLHLLDTLLGSESAGLDAVALFNSYEEQDRLGTGESSIPSVQMQLCIYYTYSEAEWLCTIVMLVQRDVFTSVN